MKKFTFLVLFTAAVASAQLPASPKSKSDAEKIASALGAGPKSVTHNATVLDWPSSPSGEFRVLRAGSNGWTCLPGFPGASHDEPGCYDQVFLQFVKDSMAGRTPNLQNVGISYMYGGKWVPNTSRANPVAGLWDHASRFGCIRSACGSDGQPLESDLTPSPLSLLL